MNRTDSQRLEASVICNSGPRWSCTQLIGRKILLILLGMALIGSSGADAALQKDHSTSLVFPTPSHAPLRKATGTHLFLAVGARTAVDNPQGTAVTKLKALDDPDSEKDDDELTVYGVNAGRNEIIYNTSLLNIEIYREAEGSPGSLFNPRGITCDREGQVFVADMGNRRVVLLLNQQGKKLVYGGSSRPGSTSFGPFDVSLARDGTVFVSDSTGGKIWRWYPEEDSWEIVLSGLETPLGIATYDGQEQWTRYRETRLGIVVDGGKTVIITNYKGDELYRYKQAEKKVGFRYIATDYFNNYYITDVMNSRVVKLDRHGQFLDSIGREGTGDYEFVKPQGIAIWKRFGQVCIAESHAAQYYLIGTDILDLEYGVRRGRLRIHFTLTEGATISIALDRDRSPKKISLIEDKRIFQGGFTHWWDIPDSFASGRYRIVITATPIYSSTKYFTAREEITWDYKGNHSRE